MPITGKTYDNLKFLALVLLPALGTLYFTLAGIWGLPAAEEVIGTIVAVDTFLGVVLHISSNQFIKESGGLIRVTEGEGRKLFSLELNKPPEELEDAQQVLFRVQKE